jgi:hypothetical protein
MKVKIFALILITEIFCCQFAFAQQRGAGVRVKGSNGLTIEIKLYDGSHTLIIGESDYTAGS